MLVKHFIQGLSMPKAIGRDKASPGLIPRLQRSHIVPLCGDFPGLASTKRKGVKQTRSHVLFFSGRLHFAPEREFVVVQLYLLSSLFWWGLWVGFTLKKDNLHAPYFKSIINNHSYTNN